MERFSRDDYELLNEFDPESGVIRIYSEITPRLVRDMNEFIEAFLGSPTGVGILRPSGEVQKKYIWMEIMSKGGCAKSGLAIYDALKSNIPDFVDIITIANGYVCSSASIIFCAGTKRLAYPSADFILHQPSVSSIEGTKDDVRQQADYLHIVERQMVEIYNATFGPEGAAVIEQMQKEEVILGAEEAAKCGLVTAVMKHKKETEAEVAEENTVKIEEVEKEVAKKVSKPVAKRTPRKKPTT